jgi:pyrroloquinoline quinone biosynthesis protein B
MIIKILGTAANGGIPQWDCCCQNCERARQLRNYCRTRSSIAVSADNDEYLIIDTGPDLKFQLWWSGLTPKRKVDDTVFRESRIGAILLTHGHGDHTSGLAEFSTGKSFEIPVYAPTDLIEFLFGNETRTSYFGELGRLAENYVVPCAIREGEHVNYNGMDFTGFEIEHTVTDAVSGEKYPSSTFGYEVVSDSKRLVYIPDLGELSEKLLKKVEGADVFILDATFWWNNELERTSNIPVTSYDLGHVPVEDSSLLLKSVDVEKILYTHLNHTNPLNEPSSKQKKLVKELGLEIAYDGCTIKL